MSMVLDTSAYSFLRAGHEEVLARVARADVILVPAVVLGELAAGFELGRRREENRVALAAFLSEPFVVALPVDDRVARRYGSLFAELRRAGTPIPTNDIWIAAATQVAGGTLLTFDGDFRHVPGLDLVLLAP